MMTGYPFRIQVHNRSGAWLESALAQDEESAWRIARALHRPGFTLFIGQWSEAEESYLDFAYLDDLNLANVRPSAGEEG
jgi:hypothetical protein